MGGLFSKPSIDSGPPPTPPPPPTLANTQPQGDQAALEAARRMQRGRSATILTGGSGLSSTGTTSKTLLGG